MAISYYKGGNYTSLYINPWDITYSLGITMYQMEQSVNEIGLKAGATTVGTITSTDVVLDQLEGTFESIELMWNQWNCSPTQKNVWFGIFLSTDGGTTWINSDIIWRTTYNGTKVRAEGIITNGSITLNRPKFKFTLIMDKTGGYEPRVAEELYVYFNYKQTSTQQTPNTMVSNATMCVPSVNAIRGQHNTVTAPLMEAYSTFLEINPMSSWNGTHAAIGGTVATSKITLLAPLSVYGTGDLSPIINAEVMEAVGVAQVPFVKDQELAEIVCEDLVVNKEVVLEVEMYDI